MWWSLALTLPLLVGACGGNDDPADDPGEPPSVGGVPAPNGGLTVADAKTTDASGPLLVRGHVVSNGEGTRLCEGIDDASPPDCTGEAAELRGFDTGGLDGSGGDSKWSTSEQRVLVEREGDAFVVSSTSR